MEQSQSIERFASYIAHHVVGALAPVLEEFQPMAMDGAVERFDNFELVDAPGEMVWDGFFYPERW